MSKVLTLRLKAKDGQHVINQLTTDSTAGDLKHVIADLTKIPTWALQVLQGFPPRRLSLEDDARTLASLSLQTGDALIAEEDAEARERREEAFLQQVQQQFQRADGFLARRVVPSDNSCLFTSINLVMEDGVMDPGSARAMRRLIARVVAGDAQTYNRAFLGKPNKEYCRWITEDATWGGAIEISILSQHYGAEIDVVDTQSGRVDRFGEDRDYERRVLLLYDGVHYDPLVLERVEPDRPAKTVFSIHDHAILAQAQEIGEEARASRQFTDVAAFSLRCLVCRTALRGQAGAQQHAQDTGHVDFGEV